MIFPIGSRLRRYRYYGTSTSKVHHTLPVIVSIIILLSIPALAIVYKIFGN